LISFVFGGECIAYRYRVRILIGRQNDSSPEQTQNLNLMKRDAAYPRVFSIGLIWFALIAVKMDVRHLVGQRGVLEIP
jgi:hypothetical protein